jgi:NarL family two-component system sensor histidine kinase YdfH
MNVRLNSRPLRWLLLLWAGLVYVWGLSSVWGLVGEEGCGGLALPPLFVQCPQAMQHVPGKPGQILGGGSLSPLWISIFTALMALQGMVLWISLSEKKVWGRHWFLFLIQGMLTLAVCVLVQQEHIAFGLFLTVLFTALTVFRQTRPLLLAASSSVVLFIASITGIEVLRSTSTQGIKADWWYSLWNLPDIAALLLFTVAYLLLYVQQLRSHAELETAHLKLQASTERIEELTRLTERQRLARELHDTLAQDLAGLIRQLEVADAQQSRQHYQRAQEIIRQATLRARSALVEARLAIHDLRIETMSAGGFSEAVQQEIGHFTETTGIRCETDLDALLDIPPHFREPALRMFTEGLHNVMRHAQAHQVWVRIVRHACMLTLEVRDDGVGFEPAAAITQTGHYGLIGLRERARLFGGTLEVSSAPGAGTTIQFRLPEHARGGQD